MYRLKQTLLNYLFILITLLLLWKILDSSRECPTSKDKRGDHHVDVDPWNINDHNPREPIILDNGRDRNHMQVNFDPLRVPELDQTNLKEDILHTLEPGVKGQDGWGPHKLAVIVPFKNRFEELKEFVPYINDYLNRKKIKHAIYVINQVDNHRFNRASLINIGFQAAANGSCDYLAMHDVDLLPVNVDLNYGFPERGPFHVAAPHLHPKYHYKTFVGGILILSMKQFEDLNGLSNMFWGWGREDDEFYMRIVDKGYKIFRHGKDIKTGYKTFHHIHGPERKRDYAKLNGQKKAMFSRDLKTGLDTLKYELVKSQLLTIDGHPCNVIDVKLVCDYQLTPWCDLPTKRKKGT